MKKILLILLCLPFITLAQSRKKRIIKTSACISGDCENGIGTYIAYPKFVKGTHWREHNKVWEYEGEWRDGERSGQGTWTSFDKLGRTLDKYVGGWLADEIDGEGKYTYNSGLNEGANYYVGEFEWGKKNGYGTYTHAGNFERFYRYVGEWMDDKFIKGKILRKYVAEGEAYKIGNQTYLPTFVKDDFIEYEGEFKDDMKHGQGTQFYSNGEKHEGEWKDGMKNGQGTYTYADGTVNKGLWKDDVFIATLK